MSARMTTRQKQAVASKLKISEIAIDLMRKKGFEGVTIREICKKAGVSIGAFYHHFESKEKIIEHVFREIEGMAEQRVQSKIYNNSIDEINAILTESCKILQHELGWAFVAQSYKLIISRQERYSLSSERYAYSGIKNAIEKGIKKGELNETTDPKFLSVLIMRLSRGTMIDWCIREGEFELSEAVVKDVEALLSGFADNID